MKYNISHMEYYLGVDLKAGIYYSVRGFICGAYIYCFDNLSLL